MLVSIARVMLFGSVVLATACERTNTPAESSPAPAPAPAASESLPDRDPALAHRLVEEEGGILLDVRTAEEFAEGHLPGAHNIPHDAVPGRLEEIEQLLEGNKDTPIVVYCRSGRRAGIAKESLVEHGFSRVTNLGGQEDW